KNACRLQQIVDDLLDLSRLESGGWRPELQPLQVARIAEEAWGPFRERAAEKGVAFLVEPGDAVPARADPPGLRQIFSNLFDNALRHTPAGGRIAVHVGVSCDAGAVPGARAGRLGEPLAVGHGAALGHASHPAAPDPAGRWVVVEVRDTGSGIPRDALPRIFERFYRVDPARSRAEGGTGLGLSIVKHLVESMGGDVAAESELGKGTTIRFRLPAADAPVALHGVRASAPFLESAAQGVLVSRLSSRAEPFGSRGFPGFVTRLLHGRYRFLARGRYPDPGSWERRIVRGDRAAAGAGEGCAVCFPRRALEPAGCRVAPGRG